MSRVCLALFEYSYILLFLATKCAGMRCGVRWGCCMACISSRHLSVQYEDFIESVDGIDLCSVWVSSICRLFDSRCSLHSLVVRSLGEGQCIVMTSTSGQESLESEYYLEVESTVMSDACRDSDGTVFRRLAHSVSLNLCQTHLMNPAMWVFVGMD